MPIASVESVDTSASAPSRTITDGDRDESSALSLGTIASQTGRFRPVPGLAGYKILLDNVFDCSANLHSGPGIGLGSSYNCFREIAKALHLEQPAVAA